MYGSDAAEVEACV